MPENRPPVGWSVEGALDGGDSHAGRWARRARSMRSTCLRIGRRRDGRYRRVTSWGVLKRMCTSCKTCKLRDENMYRNFDDEKKHYLVLMMGDFRDANNHIIPEELLWRFKGEFPGEIKLETQKGDIHTIAVAKNQEKHVLTLGWSQFVEIYDPHMGDSLILKYNGNSQFDVIIFDNLGREKALSVVLDPFMNQVQDRRSGTHEIGSARNMDAPCGRCKSYLEYYYMNLDDEKKYLSMLMMGDFQNEMIIPEEFVKRFKGEIPGKITLETKNHCSYIIGVAKQQEKLVLTAGWGNFVETFALQMGDTIVFRYNGNSKFSVIIFDNLGCENALSVVVDPFVAPAQERHTKPMERQTPTSRVNGPPMESMESPPTKRQRRLQMDKSCQGNMAPINNFSSESSEECFSSEDGHGAPDVPDSNWTVGKKSWLSSFQKEQLKDGYVTTHKTKLTWVQKEVVKQKVQSIDSEIPIVVAVMSKSNVDSGCSVKYAVRFGETSQDNRLRSGWKKFVEDNNLRMGDICLFELLSNQGIRTMELITAALLMVLA
ncbi:hypothetical protein ACQ4PT_009599 [Festuca glaucescens]